MIMSVRNRSGQYRSWWKQSGITFPISVYTPPRTKALVPTLRVGTLFVPLRGALDVSQPTTLVPTLRVGTLFVPLRGALDVNQPITLVPTLRVGTLFVPLRGALDV